MKEKKYYIIIHIVLILFFLITNHFGTKENLQFLEEQNELEKALEYSNLGKYEEAIIIFEKYEENSRYNLSVDYCANYALALINNRSNNDEKIKKLLLYSINNQPKLLKDQRFLGTFSSYISYSGEEQ